jgi:hypothetical protein
MDPEIWRAAMDEEERRASLHVEIPWTPLESEDSVAQQQLPELKVPIVPVQQLSLNSPALATSDFHNPMDTTMIAGDDPVNDFFLMMDIGFLRLPAQFLGLNVDIRASLQECFDRAVNNVRGLSIVTQVSSRHFESLKSLYLKRIEKLVQIFGSTLGILAIETNTGSRFIHASVPGKTY